MATGERGDALRHDFHAEHTGQAAVLQQDMVFADGGGGGKVVVAVIGDAVQQHHAPAVWQQRGDVGNRANKTVVHN